MKLLILTLCSFLLLGATAQAKWAERTSWNYQHSQWSQHSQTVVDALNVVYPDLNVQIIRSGDDATILSELALLRDELHGLLLGEGSLVHLACKRPACGGQ